MPLARVKTYRRKAGTIEAIQWDGTKESQQAIFRMGAEFFIDRATGMAELRAGLDGCQGFVPVPVLHWVAKGSNRDYWPIDPTYFEDNYERAD